MTDSLQLKELLKTSQRFFICTHRFIDLHATADKRLLKFISGILIGKSLMFHLIQPTNTNMILMVCLQKLQMIAQLNSIQLMCR